MKETKPARAYSAVACVAVLAIAAVAAACTLAAAAPAGGVIRIPLPVSDAAVYVGANGAAAFTGTDIQCIGQTGEPSLPFRSVRVLLPPYADLDTVKASVAGYRWIGIDGEWDISPVGPYATGDGEETLVVWPADRNIIDGRDADIYESDALFPSDPVVNVDTQVLRGWKMVQVFYALMAYNPVEKKVFQLSGSAIEITFERTPLTTDSAPADLTATDEVREMTVNFTDVAGEYGSYALSADTGRYVIITTSAIQAASSNLMDFVASKEARGFTVQVVTEGTWQNHSGNNDTGDAAAEHIRSWLKSNYIGLNIKYVLLIGNPNPTSGTVPMKMCYPQDSNAAYPDCPTDFYYAELTSDWDGDTDGLYGEYDDDFHGYPPRVAETAVGRIPYYGNTADLDHILSKIMAYEAVPGTDISWHRLVLLPMKPSDDETPGYSLGEEIKDDVLDLNGWTYHRVYDDDYLLDPLPETMPCTVTNVTSAWTYSDFGAVFWWTHGSETSASGVMDLSHAATLDDAHPSFTFQASCENGAPEAPNNLGYSLLKNGCVSTVSASRVSWYRSGQGGAEDPVFAGTATNSGMTFEYAQRLIDGAMYAGDALNGLKADIWPYDEVLWMNYLDFNLYGCPAVGLSTPPLAETRDAASITTTSALLNAKLTSLGTADNVSVSFVWGTTEGGPYPNETAGQVKTVPVTFYFDRGGLTPGTTYYYRAKAAGWGTGYGEEKSFTTQSPPAVSTGTADLITVSSATLNGNLISKGTAASVTVSFEWGESTLYGNETSSDIRTDNVSFSASLTGLDPNKTYHFRAKGDGDGSPVYGLDESFTTLPIPPSVTTDEPGGVTSDGATLNGYLLSKGSTTDNVMVSFQWGTFSGNYDYETAAQVMPSPGAFHFDLSGLANGTRFFYRAKSVGDGTAYGLEKSFTTGTAPPSVSTKSATNITSTSATLAGDLDDLGTATTVSVSIEWKAFGGSYAAVAAGGRDSAGVFSVELTDLTPGTTYHYRAKAVGDGTVYGTEEKSFVTLRPPEVSSVDPGSGGTGQRLTVIITGADLTGATAVSLGADIAVDSFTVVSATQMSVAVCILCDGAPGTRDVTVTTPGGTDSLANGLTIAVSLPNQPQNTSPADDAGIMTLTPKLSASAFSHPCPLSTHAASQWQVTGESGDYSNPLDDTTVGGGDLTSFTLPVGVMGSAQQYWWRVRYQDNSGGWSDWSEETSLHRPDFIRAELNGSAEIRVYDSTSGVTGSVDGEDREEIADSEYASGIVYLLSLTGPYQYRVVGTEEGSYTLTITRAVGNQSVVLRARGIPVSDKEMHWYVVDWDALSSGGRGVTINIDSDGDGEFEKAVLMDGDIDSNEFASATKDKAIPSWVWLLLVVGVIAGALAILALVRADRQRKQSAAES